MILNFIDQFMLLVLVLITIIFNLNLSFLVIAYVVSNLPGFIMLLLSLYKKYGYYYKFDLSKAGWLVKESFPLLGAIVLTVLFQQGDILFLKYFKSDSAAGIYSAATRLAMPLGIISTAIITTIFPMISKKNDNYRESEILKSTFKLLFICSFAASVIMSFNSEPIIVSLFGYSYKESAIPFVLILWSYIFIFFNNLSVNLLTIKNKQKYNLIFSFLLLGSNFIAIILLLGPYSFVGTAIAKLIATVFGGIILLNLNIKFKNQFNFFNLKNHPLDHYNNIFCFYFIKFYFITYYILVVFQSF